MPAMGDDARRANTECSIGMGLFRRQHFDLHHTQLRYATSFLLSVGYFAWVPAAFLTFDAPQAGLIVGLQAAGFATLTLGMFIDRVLEWPDAPLVRGEARAMRCATLSWLPSQSSSLSTSSLLDCHTGT